MNAAKMTGILAILIFLAGCAASGMKDVAESGFLKDYSMLHPGAKDEAALIYIKPGVDFKPYNKIMFARVLISVSDDAENKEIDPAMYTELAEYYQKALIDAVNDAYEIVDKPGENVLLVRVAVTGVKPSNPVANTMSSIIPVGIVVAGATKAASGDNLGTGEASTEMEMVDSVTGERLAAAVDRRQGGKGVFRGKWEDTKDAFDYWAKRFRLRLDDARGV